MLRSFYDLRGWYRIKPLEGRTILFNHSQQKAHLSGLLFGLKPVNGLLEGNVCASDSNFT
jgi:hypothetical protein